LKKRILRIYPGFICATLLTFGFVMTFSPGGLAGLGATAKLIKALWRMVSLTDLKYVGVFMSNPYPGVVNVSLWTIRLEFLCYLGLGLLGISGILRRRRLCLLLFLLSLALSIAVSNSGLMSYYGDGVNTDRAGMLPFLTRLLPAYLAGVLTYLYFDRFVISTWLTITAVIATGLSLFIPHGLLITLPIFGSYLLFSLAFNRTIRLNHFARHGDFSYGTYLYAFPIQQMLVSRFGGSINWWILCLLSIPASVAVAAMSWHFVEKRFLPRTRVVLTTA
jgi:peptidoglycan/LPS O-acetylase OafA/YrhL